ncbi:molybdenum cofactor biosynthesis protein MoaE [Alteromonas flava]|uniref:molybdenum cofactor biosynthesis protein MoaE n=1 Tax=Alteromonas flava TaxID=2048003 RepID=UPI000C284EBC|nr:molybdenum cofactor biosynthesis protein MoaE [Alteromonas flava]
MVHTVRLQHADFDISALYAELRQAGGCGAIVTFTGVARDYSPEQQIQAIELEHYPGMTEASLESLAVSATQRFAVEKLMLIHRVGLIHAHEQIVFVGTASPHRKAAFDCAQFVMDRLKTDVPLWKKEQNCQGEWQWVEMKQRDKEAAKRW